jgi:prepilin-type N-terminal cleavage/methylation domain-containing protein
MATERSRRTRAREEDGFTLVELLVVVFLIAIVGTVLASGLVQGIRTTNYTQNRAEALAHTQTGIERLSRELRAAEFVGVAASDHVELAIRRDEPRMYYYVYRTEAAGDVWNLTEERWQFDDGFDGVPDKNDADQVTTRVLVPGLVTGDVFTFSDSQVDIRLERRSQQGRGAILVETTVQMRNWSP